MAPRPMMPNQASTWRSVFHAMVAIRSPSLMPSRSSAFATRSARERTSASVQRRIGPSTLRVTISRSPWFSAPWSMMVWVSSG